MADIYIGNVKGPQGDTGATGPQGAAGDAATIQVGTVSTTAYGNPAQVVNSGTEHAAVLNFTIPQGAPGATVTQLDNLALNTITTSTDQYPQIQVGDIGRVIFGKIIKFFQDLVTGLAAKINYSDALTMEEIEASSDLTDKVSAAAASKTLKESLSPFIPYGITPRVIAYTGNLNDISVGVYYVNPNQASNLPVQLWGWCIAINDSASDSIALVSTQFYFTISTFVLYMRHHQQDGTWSAWKSITFS